MEPVASVMPREPRSTSQSPENLQKVAIEFEAAFITEMLKAAKFGEARDLNGGGAGEEAYASLLLHEYAKAMAETGGMGLAEHIVRALSQASEPSA